MTNDRNFIESISRGFAILSIVSESVSGLSLTELSQRTQLSKSTIQRLTYTLLKLELLERNQETKRFRLGPKMISMALSAAQNLDVNKVALPFMRETAGKIGETVGLAILSGSDIIYTNYAKTTNILNVELRIGDRFPVHVTSMGRAILAFLAEPQLESILRNLRLVRYTPNTIANKADLLRELKRVKREGFSTNNEETHVGVRSVAAPVRDSTGEVVAAVNIIVPTIRSSKKELETILARKVVEMADQISLVMGYRKGSG